MWNVVKKYPQTIYFIITAFERWDCPTYLRDLSHLSKAPHTGWHRSARPLQLCPISIFATSFNTFSNSFGLVVSSPLGGGMLPPTKNSSESLREFGIENAIHLCRGRYLYFAKFCGIFPKTFINNIQDLAKQSARYHILCFLKLHESIISLIFHLFKIHESIYLFHISAIFL